MTQTARVIKAARSFRGVSQVDFLGPDTVDGGPPITRLAARLWDAEQQGYSFECIGWRDKCKCWRLIGEPDEGDSAAKRIARGVGTEHDHELEEEHARELDEQSAPSLFPSEPVTAHWRAA